MWHILWNVLAVIGVITCVSAAFVFGWMCVDEINIRKSRKNTTIKYTQYFTKEDKEND